MSDVSSIGVAVVNTANPNTSPSSANSGRGASGNDLPLAPVLAKLSTAEQSREVLEKTRESLASAVEKRNEYVRSTKRDLRFSYAGELGSTIATVLDGQPKEVIGKIH